MMCKVLPTFDFNDDALEGIGLHGRLCHSAEQECLPTGPALAALVGRHIEVREY